ncbi:hypothetical protein DSC45_28105 [Streptomyces sp. YIM 130001]|uniref:hypothetical protein n=1 Tax=Streptomyces sp. YIM 130001 TaxID=2259644 RepID=UPI000E65554D|nr:hypothetical protein [Streptomyces sp. YIM 130001]RII11779.1 hypothetical protein DSC45_28105 [Streptomyces sp. YIM 130001]
MTRGRTVLNRLTLGATGLVLLTAGGWLALARTTWVPGLPGARTPGGEYGTFVDPAQLAAVRDRTWWTPVVVTVSVLATVLLAVWCARQLGSGFRRRIELAAPGADLRTRALESAMTEHAEDLDGVSHCRARVRVRRARLDVILRVRLRPDTGPATVLPGLTALASTTEASLAPHRVRTRVRFATRSHRRPHVR